jgi:ankyrin repeat protein
MSLRAASAGGAAQGSPRPFFLRGCLHFVNLVVLSLVFSEFFGLQAEIEAVDSSGWTALHRAANYGKDAVATQLIQAKANVNAADNYGDTPLHSAAWNGHAAVVELLLGAKASPTAVNKNGKTPAQHAEQSEHGNVAARLRKADQQSVGSK